MLVMKVPSTSLTMTLMIVNSEDEFGNLELFKKIVKDISIFLETALQFQRSACIFPQYKGKNGMPYIIK
jgi:hypothetical protein